MQLSKEEVRKVWDSDRKQDRRRLLIAVLIVAAIFVFCLTIRYQAYYYDEKFVPGQYFESLWTAVRLFFSRITGSAYYDNKSAVIEAIGENFYLGAIARLKMTVMALIAGAALAIAGAVFQTIYKNPMASPNILGASAGISLGNILMVMMYSEMAIAMVYTRYKICYLLTAICVVAVLLLGKFAGDHKGNPSVMEMVMVGSIVSQGINVFTQYYMYNMEDSDMLIYQEMTLGTYQQLDLLSLSIFLVLMAISIIPMILLRYHFNVTSVDVVDARTAGVEPMPIRMVGQICGVIMVAAATIHCGEIGMLSMVIPYAVRHFVGADFRKVLLYSFLTGGGILMLCRMLTSFILIVDSEIPVSFILNIALTPVFMVILAKQKRGFE